MSRALLHGGLALGIVRKLDRVAKGRPRKRILRVPRHSGSIHFPIEYIKLNQSHAVVCRREARTPRTALQREQNGMAFINSGYPRNGGVPRNALLAFSVE